jgi:hypothetical protein
MTTQSNFEGWEAPSTPDDYPPDMSAPACQCEHIRHFPEEWGTRRWYLGHKYLTGVGRVRAEYVGLVCKWCATHCVSDYLI